MGKYPVISISLKDVEGMDFQKAYDMLGSVISEAAGRFDYLLGSNRLTLTDKKKLNCLIEEEFEKAVNLYRSLRVLTQLLFKHYGIPVIVLIDEYDVPLDKAYQNGYYPEMVSLIRSLFSQVLKTNENLYFAEYFGFTDKEVRDMLSYYGVEDSFGEIKEWYDGYHFGNVDVYFLQRDT